MTGTLRSMEARARVFGDHINSDYIIASTRKRDTLDEAQLKQWLLEAVDPGFAASVQPGDVLVAGRNFGCGSAMEVAVTVILAAGIPAVLAQSFARAFFRNAVNNGLMPLCCDTGSVREGDRLHIHVAAAGVEIRNLTRDAVQAAEPLPDIALSLLEAGGLVPFLRAHGRLPAG